MNRILPTIFLLLFFVNIKAQEKNVPEDLPTSYSADHVAENLLHFLDSVSQTTTFHPAGRFIPIPALTGIENTIGSRKTISWKFQHHGAAGRIQLFTSDLVKGDSLVFFNSKGEISELVTSRGSGTYTSEPISGMQVVQLRTSSPDPSEIEFYSLGLEPLPAKHKVQEFGDSEFCQVNINCVDGEEYDDVRNSVVRILLRKRNLYGYCTGTLMNNSNFDNKPYILTAEHCGIINQQFVSNFDLGFWAFYFNYQSPGCADPGSESGLNNQKLNGAQLVARSDDNGGATGSDFLLLKLNSNIPSSFNAYYAGWNRSDKDRPHSGATIHHPEGDIKKISFFSYPAAEGSFTQGLGEESHYLVRWSPSVNGFGTTEAGSSGAPLFDDQQLVRGQLTGGSSSCSSPDEVDYFGKMSFNWSGNGSFPENRLGYWLDPAGSNYMALKGSYPGDAIPELNTSFTYFPSPAAGEIFVGEFGHPSEEVHLQISDLFGKVIYSRNTVSTPGVYENVDVSKWRNGLYLISVIVGDKIETRKIMILNP